MGYIEQKQHYEVNLFTGAEVSKKAKPNVRDCYVFFTIAMIVTVTFLLQWAAALDKFGDKL